MGIISRDQGKRPTGKNTGKRNNRSFKTTENSTEGQRQTFDTIQDMQFYQDTVLAQDPKSQKSQRFRQSWNPHPQEAILPTHLAQHPQYSNVMSDPRLAKKRAKVNDEPVKPLIDD
jgi:hypothetical protein